LPLYPNLLPHQPLKIIPYLPWFIKIRWPWNFETTLQLFAPQCVEIVKGSYSNVKDKRKEFAMPEEEVHVHVEDAGEACCDAEAPCCEEEPRQQVRVEEFVISGDRLVKKLKSLVHESGVRRISLKDEKGQTLIEVPLVIGVAGAMAGAFWMPVWAAIGAIAALVTNLRVVVERVEEQPTEEMR
jgi:hypothetical protein